MHGVLSSICSKIFRMSEKLYLLLSREKHSKEILPWMRWMAYLGKLLYLYTRKEKLSTF